MGVEIFEFHVKKNLFHHLFLHGLHCYDMFLNYDVMSSSKSGIFIDTSFCHRVHFSMALLRGEVGISRSGLKPDYFLGDF